jgi:hypothetical protein
MSPVLTAAFFEVEKTVQQRTIDIEKIVAAAVIAIGLGFSSGQARSEDAAQEVLPAPSALDAGKPRPIVVKSMVAGGLRPGEVMVLTAHGAERMSPARLAQQYSPASKLGSSSDCVTF